MGRAAATKAVAAWRMYVNWSAALGVLVPPEFVTITSTVPEPGGDMTVSCVPVLPVTVVGAEPNMTVAPVKFAPLIVTGVPPAAGPDDGLIEVTVGGGGALLPWYPVDVTCVVSDVVRRDSVEELEAFGGFVTPTSLMLTLWLAGMVWPVLSEQVSVVVLLKLQNPTAAPAVVSVTVELVIGLRPVPAGKLTVIWLFAVFDNAPVAEVATAIVYVTPWALGARLESVTVGWEGWPAGPMV